MFPTLEGVIQRRVLLNFQINPALIKPYIPKPLEILVHRGWAVAGICLIRLENIRPKGLPGWTGFSAENMAHRIAIRFPSNGRMLDGVFIWRRETNSRLMPWVGGRLFPGVHQHADFSVKESPSTLHMDVSTQDSMANIQFTAARLVPWENTTLFQSFTEVKDFFRAGDCGFSCGHTAIQLEGLRLATNSWNMEPLRITNIKSAFYERIARHHSDQLIFDCGLLMQNVPHEWYGMKKLNASLAEAVS
jgi:hypothetical protein